MTKMSLTFMVESILRRGLLNNLISARFIDAAIWMLAFPTDRMKIANAAFIEKFIAVQYDNVP